MAKKIKLTHDQKIIKALEKIKTPIVDKLRNLSIYFKVQSRSNESGLEHIAKNYHGLDPSDIEILEDCIKNPIEHSDILPPLKEVGASCAMTLMSQA